jgi:uncharacterized protein Veg
MRGEEEGGRGGGGREWTNVHKEELHCSYSSTIIIRVINSRVDEMTEKW